MITIDGRMGEGGGQVLRTSLALAMITGQSVHIGNIRAGRQKPGLMRQHLTAVGAATAVCSAEVEGAEISSRELTFRPGQVAGGHYEFAVGIAGSAALVLQTVLPALLTARETSTLLLEGGTHNMGGPPFDFLDRTFLPLVNRLGPRVTAELERLGFYPAGGGMFNVTIEPAAALAPLEILERGPISEKKAVALVAHLPLDVALRELAVVHKKLGIESQPSQAVKIESSPGPGNVVMVSLRSGQVNEVFTGFGRPNASAETVAENLCREVRRYLAAGVPVGEHLADQLLVLMATAGGKFRTVTPSRHTTTNIEVIKAFLPVEITTTCVDEAKSAWEIEVRKA